MRNINFRGEKLSIRGLFVVLGATLMLLSLSVDYSYGKTNSMGIYIITIIIRR